MVATSTDGSSDSVRQAREHTFVRAKIAERREAAMLRRSDWSLRRIAAELGVSISSVSVWVRDIPGLPRQTKPKKRSRFAGRPNRTTGRRPGEPLTQRCSRCRNVLAIEMFNVHGDRRQWWCKECFRPIVLEFDHIGSKRMEVSRMVNLGANPREL